MTNSRMGYIPSQQYPWVAENYSLSL